jgi:hypothetical protein
MKVFLKTNITPDMVQADPGVDSLHGVRIESRDDIKPARPTSIVFSDWGRHYEGLNLLTGELELGDVWIETGVVRALTGPYELFESTFVPKNKIDGYAYPVLFEMERLCAGGEVTGLARLVEHEQALDDEDAKVRHQRELLEIFLDMYAVMKRESLTGRPFMEGFYRGEIKQGRCGEELRKGYGKSYQALEKAFRRPRKK